MAKSTRSFRKLSVAGRRASKLWVVDVWVEKNVGARNTLDLNSAGQQELRDRTIEVRADATDYAQRGFWACKSVHSKRSMLIVRC